MKNNEVTNFMLYIYNKWCIEESVLLFGENLGRHIFRKWVQDDVTSDRSLYWYFNLDNECRQKIVDRANVLYNK